MTAAQWWRSLAAVLGGSAVAQAIPIGASLLLARLVAPADYGLYATWLAFASLAAVILTLRFESAVPLESDPARRRVALLAVLGTAGMVSIAVASLALVARAAVQVEVPLPLMVLGWASSLGLGGSTAFQLWLTSEGRFRQLSVLRVVQAASISGAQLFLCAIWPSAVSLALGYAVGIAAALVYAVAGPLRSSATAPPEGAPGSPTALEFLRRRRRFAMLSLPAGLLGVLAEQLPLFLVGGRFGPEAAGHLALAMRTVGAAIGLLTSAVLDVFRRESAAAWNERGQCAAEFGHTFRVLAPVALVLALAGLFGAEPSFAHAFGARWQASGTIVVWLLPMIALRVVASPLSYVFFVSGRLGFDLVWQLTLVVVTVATLSSLTSLSASLLAYGWSYAAMYAVYLVVAYRLSQGRPLVGRDPASR